MIIRVKVFTRDVNKTDLKTQRHLRLGGTDTFKSLNNMKYCIGFWIRKYRIQKDIYEMIILRVPSKKTRK